MTPATTVTTSSCLDPQNNQLPYIHIQTPVGIRPNASLCFWPLHQPDAAVCGAEVELTVHEVRLVHGAAAPVPAPAPAAASEEYCFTNYFKFFSSPLKLLSDPTA